MRHASPTGVVDPPELVRVAMLLEFGINGEGLVMAAPWSDPSDVPRLCIARHAHGYVVYMSQALDPSVRRRIAEIPPERLYSGVEVDHLLGPSGTAERIEWELGRFPVPGPADGDAAVARHGDHFIDLVDGRPVSWAWTVREHARAASVAVETVPPFRRQGRGARVLRAWVADVSAKGKIPLETHAPGDLPAAALVRRVGAIPFAREVRYR